MKSTVLGKNKITMLSKRLLFKLNVRAKMSGFFKLNVRARMSGYFLMVKCWAYFLGQMLRIFFGSNVAPLFWVRCGAFFFCKISSCIGGGWEGQVRLGC